MSVKTKIDGYDYYKSLPKEQQELITNVMISTMDMCNELMKDEIKYPIVFTESMAYNCFRDEMLGHMLNNEYYDFNTKTWNKLK